MLRIPVCLCGQRPSELSSMLGDARPPDATRGRLRRLDHRSCSRVWLWRVPLDAQSMARHRPQVVSYALDDVPVIVWSPKLLGRCAPRECGRAFVLLWDARRAPQPRRRRPGHRGSGGKPAMSPSGGIGFPQLDLVAGTQSRCRSAGEMVSASPVARSSAGRRIGGRARPARRAKRARLPDVRKWRHATEAGAP